ncbi:methionine--tRNA ligase [Candidatus Nardonella dryophthoridicola]|nr:methionine--tRNA ligase [Candidatus Nardonella dryophthoridicola]
MEMGSIPISSKKKFYNMNLFKDNKILVTCALPYSNGPIHIGHLLEHIQADIWVRYKKYNFYDVKFICSDDSHGTSILLKSNNLKINPKKLISDIYVDHKKDLKKFNINYNIYYSTHSLENMFFLNNIYNILLKKKLIFKKNVYQFYDKYYSVFLSDRLFVSNCKVCLSKLENNNYCVLCNNYYRNYDIINPISLLSNKKPILKKTEHLFFKLNEYKEFLKEKILNIIFQKEVLNKIYKVFDNDLELWDISRDKLYFGFKIPNEKNKYFCVWFDAIIGYISTFYKLCKVNNLNFFEYWNEFSNCKLYQFIGKDIVYFHSIFWLSILKSINFRIPNKLIVHGHITINNNKMSKSLNNYITAKDYINKNIDTDFLRYFYASKLSNNINDIDFNTKEFIYKVNNVLINKILNIPNRVVNFLYFYFNGFLSSSDIEDINLYNIFLSKHTYINLYYNNFEYNLVIKIVEELSDLLNKYISDREPWNKINNKKKLHDICTMVINLFKILFIYLRPILPNISKKVEFFLGIKLDIKFIYIYLFNIKINKYFITKKILDIKF